ncbi:TetR/AcrR family transcriptional regulator [Pedobacter gandavensis]|uniref:TetR/AcrR family transcriptional regulator n=1 Tax=Pedobacter gandavensis TaxID=2679963 RepID=UPI00292F8D7E|nr:TetR/AcrR family transcriptional regulator [Pedobacter gandavensis]
MDQLLSTIKIQVNDKIYVKDPETTTLGRKIIQQSLIIMDEIGFDNFTFKKLGESIGSNESSIYRYFENKHKLLVYFSSWYWSWIEYKMVFATANIVAPLDQLIKALELVTEKIEDDLNTPYMNEALLNKIIISEFTKTFLTKEVDEENKEGFFLIYKRVINRMVDMVVKINPEYPYPKSLISNIVEGALHQHFLKDHFKTITNCDENTSPTAFYTHLVQHVLSPKL